ncbi:LysR family transcriptional regulator [Paraburkholderia pallida]|uniref:LysR family transcriptional regulator n=1 Tax=Paraburkholderia pallida TaxID=2547399 RepID=A0A4P7DA38_9BURK|nr:LysR family transcriptional regulator [Paraburkholderia pallida]QBR04287.1 LysR family transcriptional regulator [Paraburkholderia pallida]
MKDLNSLLIFSMVVEASSFSEAARRLKMPVSSVSRRIAELEDQLGVRLLERTTHHLRLTDFGAEVFELARHASEVSEAVDNVISNRLPEVFGTLRLCAPPSISDSLIVPVVGAFQQAYPNVRVKAFITERIVDQIAEDVDIAFKVGTYTDATLAARTLLTYRHQVVASPKYLAQCRAPETPRELLGHRLFAFSFWKPDYSWSFVHVNGRDTETVSFQPVVAMNDYTGLIVALLEGCGIGELPPIVQPELMRDRLLVEVMPDWHLPVFDLTIANLRDRYLPRQVRIFRDFASQMVPGLFASLPV